MVTMNQMNQSTLIEWIPNISTGDEKSVNEISQLFQAIPDLYLLHIDRGPEVNRTVFTLAGTKNSLHKAIFSLMTWITQNMDMATHTGTHPRIGALDVSPFVLLNDGNREAVLNWIRQLASKVSKTFDLPIYLYEQSSSHPERTNLADIRKGEYEGLEQKIKDKFWNPDYGTRHNPQLGATVMGLRDFLIAYNVNIKTAEVAVAKSIARQIRIRGNQDRPYRLPGVKAIGWYLEQEGFCQISTNITKSRKTTPLEVYDHCTTLAINMGYQVTGSELIGLIPYHSVSAMLLQGFTTASLAGYLGLKYCGVHDLKERMIEHKVYLASGKTIFNKIFDPA